jgi:hypothetical protein
VEGAPAPLPAPQRSAQLADAFAEPDEAP